jgi:2'-5' RNA ligase
MALPLPYEAREKEGRAIMHEAVSPAKVWMMESCVLYKSDLRSSGAVYTELRSFTLCGDPSPD